MNSKRRNILKGLGLGVAAMGLPNILFAAGTGGKVVVVGGGTGGASVANYLKKLDASIEVTLIEPNSIYYTCYGSNEVISGERGIEGIQVGYDGLVKRGIKIVHDRVTDINPTAKVVTTATGKTFNYDRCVVSPGVDFKYESIEGYDAQVAKRVPHAWKAGEQTVTLRNQLAAMKDGGTVILTAPENPFRCPPGPYERVSQIAHYLKNNKPNSKIIVLDAKGSFAKQAAFELGWSKLYNYGSSDSMIEWIGNDQITKLDESTNTVTTSSGKEYKGDVINIIPNQKAGAIAFSADLTEGDWCPVHQRTFESTKHKGIHIIGDASVASPLPKSGFSANAEAKACASAIVALLRENPLPTPVFSNACYSIVGKDYGISIVAVYRMNKNGTNIEKVSGVGGVTPLSATEEDLRNEASYAHGWYNNFVKDVFG